MKKNEKILWNEKIPFIKEMKEFYYKMKYRGINLWPVMANETYTYYLSPEKDRKMKVLAFLKYLFTKDNFKIYGKKGRIFVSYIMAREDHHELMKKALKNFSEKELTWLDAYQYKSKKSLFKFSYSFPNVFLFFKIYNKFRRYKFKNLKGWMKWHFITRTYFRYKQINQFIKIYQEYSPKAYIAFCSQAFPEETIFTLICKKNNIPTFTMQHGIVAEYPHFHGASILNENILSDFHLIWGKSTYETLRKFTSLSRLIIVGNPKYSSLIENNSKRFESKKGAIFFPVPGGEADTNEKMAKAINDFAKRHPQIIFEASVHPFDNSENYKRIIDSENIIFVDSNIPIMGRIENSDLILLHNTTIAIEALRYQKPIFRFNDKFLIDLWKNNDKFKDADELDKHFKKLQDPKEFGKCKTFYGKEFEKNFKITPEKETSQRYYEEITRLINAFYHKNT